MHSRPTTIGLLFVCFLNGLSHAEPTDVLTDLQRLDLVNVKAKEVVYLGKPAINLTGTQSVASAPAPVGSARMESLAIIKNLEFTDGTIEVEVAGRPAEGVREAARGFIGIAFHVMKKDPIAYDCFYVRPTNGRADDQLRRNHTCQYMSHPEFPFHRLREEQPGVYESYADMVPGEWTKLKITVAGEKARLYVNAAEQPSLIVNDLKLAGKRGAIALWMEQSTEAYFRDLRVTQSP